MNFSHFLNCKKFVYSSLSKFYVNGKIVHERILCPCIKDDSRVLIKFKNEFGRSTKSSSEILNFEKDQSTT